MQQELGFAAIGVTVLDVIIICVSLGIKYWSFIEIGGLKGYGGLWEVCVEMGGSTECNDIEDSGTNASESDYDAVRAMLFLGLFLTLGGAACIALKSFVMKDKKEVVFAAVGLYAVAGVFLLVGFAVYRATIFEDLQDSNSEYELHAGFALCIVAWIITWALAGLSAAMAFIGDKD